MISTLFGFSEVTAIINDDNNLISKLLLLEAEQFGPNPIRRVPTQQRDYPLYLCAFAIHKCKKKIRIKIQKYHIRNSRKEMSLIYSVLQDYRDITTYLLLR